MTVLVGRSLRSLGGLAAGVLRDPGKPWQNGANESFNGKFRDECLSRRWFLNRAGARAQIAAWREEYNRERLHSAIGYVTPLAKLEGREQEIFDLRDERLEAARARRKRLRPHMRTPGTGSLGVSTAAAAL